MNKPAKSALFISPHLDDVIFSCGGMLAKMSAEGWHTILCTIFTKSVDNPQGFALACQLDKNLTAEIDYMKLRRAEDAAAARRLNVSEILHLNFLEAPHRGYNSAPELFAGVRADDNIWEKVVEHLMLLNEIHQPEIVFAPQGLGNHCDHLQTIEAVLKVFDIEKILWYYDTPYVIRQPKAEKYSKLPGNLSEKVENISPFLEMKIEACAQYETQINFQFGGQENLAKTLTDFHSKSENLSVPLRFTESFLAQKSF
jgi:LmbE family N-acetylglucosaminyl deacetylase